MAEKNPSEGESENLSPGQLQLPDNINDWTKDHVKQWVLKEQLLDSHGADILYQQDISGASLLLLEKSELTELGIKLGPAKLILHSRDELVQRKKDQVGSQVRTCKPYPFNRFHDAYRYKINSILDVTESGALNLIEPCHEFKAYINLDNTSTEGKMLKFTKEVVRFAAACMNSRTNGTIHFGVGDLPDFTHGEILGVQVDDREAFVNALGQAVEGHFQYKRVPEAKKCIKPPRFVEVLNPDMTSSEKYVIEVDVVPAYVICQRNVYHVYSVDYRKAKKNKNKEQDKGEEKKKCLFVRDGTSSKDLLAQAKPLEHDTFVESVDQLSESREKAEQDHLSEVKVSFQGHKLIDMITGGTLSLDKSHFERYIVVTNKSHPIQLESMEFLLELNPAAVLDFDPESTKNGLFKYYNEHRNANGHLPEKYKITEAVEIMAGKLKLTKNTSWVFCNGCDGKEMPSEPDKWLMDKGASVRDVISFLCRKDIMPQKRFLVVFLLLSAINDKMDPLLETFSIFWQELKGMQQILCLCENETVFIRWKDLIDSRYNVDITSRSICKLSLAEINGTILTLWSANRRSIRFLPCGGGSKVPLRKKVEDCLDTLNILCVNECEGDSEDKQSIEEHFYKGGEASWWNFYFSEKPGSMPFIKRDKFDFIRDNIIPELLTLRQGCVYFNLLHLPGCGGTTLALHILWSQKESFRCAVLRDVSDVSDIAFQVVQLLTYETAEQSTRLPVLLLLDDFEDMDAVCNVQDHIDKELVEKDLGSKGPQVILLNCMRTELSDHTASTEDIVFVGNKLSVKEQEQFQNKLLEIEKIYKNSETFYGFMIMKKNFLPTYIERLARNTLRNFNFVHRHAQLLAVLMLLSVYCKSAVLSVSLCEEFLELETKPYCGSSNIENAFENFSNLVTRCIATAKVIYDAVKAIHPSVARCCLQELTDTYKVTRTEIINLLLTNDKFFECVQGKDKLMKDIHSMLVKRLRVSGEEGSKFSPLIQDIAKKTPGAEENVLSNATKRFDKDAIMSQLLARYHYLEQKNFSLAKEWAKKAKDLCQESSYISDTSAQVIKHELTFLFTKTKGEKNPITPEELQRYLKMAVSAITAFRETQEIAKREIVLRYQRKRDNSPYNTAGCVGEIQVSVLILDILERIPVFTPTDPVRRSIMKEFLSGKLSIIDISENDKKQKWYAPYYGVLKEFGSHLCDLRRRMKEQFDFLNCFFVSFGSKFSLKDTREERSQSELNRCFSRYGRVFCDPDLLEHLTNMLPPELRQQVTNRFPGCMSENICKTQEFLEMRKADTPFGLLTCLKNSMRAEVMEDVVRMYAMLMNTRNREQHLKYTVNYIYANVVLYGIKPESKWICPYPSVLKMLDSVLSDFTQFKDSMAFHFIAVALLWPEQDPALRSHECSEKLKSLVSQMCSSFRNQMGFLGHNKWPVVHFYLGTEQGYDRLISQEKMEKCINSKESFASLWRNGRIWRQEEVKKLLCRVTGQVSHRNVLLADTISPSVKIEVKPFCRSQLCGQGRNRRVSFFLGFSMKGPLAFDVEFYS